MVGHQRKDVATTPNDQLPNKTGLLPDFIWVDEHKERAAGIQKTVESKYDGAYSYNACRLPYNLVQSKDKTGQQLMKKMLNFFMINETCMQVMTLKREGIEQSSGTSFLAPRLYYASEHEKDI